MRVASYKLMQVLYNVNSYYKWKLQLKVTFIDKHDMAAFIKFPAPSLAHSYSLSKE